VLQVKANVNWFMPRSSIHSCINCWERAESGISQGYCCYPINLETPHGFLVQLRSTVKRIWI